MEGLNLENLDVRLLLLVSVGSGCHTDVLDTSKLFSFVASKFPRI